MKIFTAALLAISSIALLAQQPNGAGVNSPWPSSQVISPADLARSLKGLDAAILQVGFAKLYDVKHIPGSIYAGPASHDLEPLKKALAGVPKNREIVLYCGCCPWDHCPNMKPAYNLLKSLGYTKIKVMEIPNNFGSDWVDKGYPVEGSAATK
ncbi:MAG TPA: rhodanese-like domain-containing protein [Bryobacteraceae bacterium]|jgi:thiosulfate/3-mercaptopyruvate sulfurtransferase|nr:rhodanese-like domain-containing protein [Bryobacteraceae bacterium]